MPSKCGIFICEEWRLAYSKEALILEKSNLESENSSNGFTEGTEKKKSVLKLEDNVKVTIKYLNSS